MPGASEQSPSLFPQRDIYTPSRLNEEVRQILDQAFPLIWVEGEISNLSRPRSGHFYFTLKDAAAQVRCAMFRNRNLHLAFRPADGQQVLVRARPGLYPARGEFQLVAEHMEEAGFGALQRAFEALKARLGAEGLFAAERKRPLPALPRRLGVITSPTGAALHDVLTVLRRRFPALPVLIYPVPVQGAGAGEQIAAALRLAAERREVDVLLLTRGGGSLEDLWAFNEEPVARALYDCAIPVVSAVGHETDVTIADLAADQRAPTPSAGAELLSPDGPAWIQCFAALEGRLRTLQGSRLRQAHQQLAGLEARLQRSHPGRRLQDRAQSLDELERRLQGALDRHLARAGQRLEQAAGRLARRDPRRRLAELGRRTGALRTRLGRCVEADLDRRRRRLTGLVRELEAVSPLATLGRGYALVSDETAGLLRDAGDSAPGRRLRVRLARGELDARVEQVRGPGSETLLPAAPEADTD